MGKTTEDTNNLKSISLIIQPVSEDGGGDEPTADRVLVLSETEPEAEAVSQQKGSTGIPSGSEHIESSLPRMKVEVVVPAERAEEIVNTMVESIYSNRPAHRPAHCLDSFEEFLEEHMEKLLGWMEGAGEGRLHGRVLQLVERSLLRAVISRTQGNQVQAAKILGINRNTLRGKLKEMKLKSGRSQSKARRRATLTREPSGPDATPLNVRVGKRLEM